LQVAKEAEAATQYAESLEEQGTVHKAQLHKLRQELGRVEADLAATNTDLHDRKRELEAVHADLDTTNADLHGRIADLEAAKTDLQGTIAHLEASQSNLQASKEEMEASRGELHASQAALAALTVHIAKLQNEVRSGCCCDRQHRAGHLAAMAMTVAENLVYT
jgi:chromosome segregation ATPase